MSVSKIRESIFGVLAIISIALVVMESLMSLSRGVLLLLYFLDLVICFIFAADFIKRLIASRSKSSFLKSNWYEIFALVPAFALYALGSLPAIAVAFRSLRLVRVIMVLARTRRLFSGSGRFFQKSSLFALAGITVAVVFIGAFAVFVFDGGTPDSQINTFSDAVWWSISTVTTVGYGDIVPQSVSGRFMGMVLMVVGIAVMTAFISQVSATLEAHRLHHEQRQDEQQAQHHHQRADQADDVAGDCREEMLDHGLTPTSYLI